MLILNNLYLILHCLIPGVLRVKVLPPLDTTGLTIDDVSGLSEKCRKIMLDAYEQIYEEHKDEYINMKPLPSDTKDK